MPETYTCDLCGREHETMTRALRCCDSRLSEYSDGGGS